MHDTFNSINGWLNIDKPCGVTSNHISTILKRKLNIKKNTTKCGFSGTLDPFATGVLVFALGDATKCINIIPNNIKGYEFTVIWGKHTDTHDIDGKILKETVNIPIVSDIESILPSFTGEILQTPPNFSAIKINGKRACDRIRKGETLSIKPKSIFIKSLEITSSSENSTSFKLSCRKGCYVRSLAIDIAKSLNSLCYVSELKRIFDGNFDIKDAISIEKLLEMDYNSIIGRLMPVDCVLDDIPAIRFNKDQIGRFCHGQFIDVPNEQNSEIVRVYYNDSLAGIATLENGVCYPKNVFIGEYDVDYKRR